MRLAKACRYPVAQVALLRVPEPVLAVQRFDRMPVSSSRVERLHVVDACQAADLSVDFKYERYLGRQRPEYRDGMSLPKLFAISKQAGSGSARMRLELMQWTLFQLVIGNSDAHGKNFSFFVRGSWLDPAAWYDLVSVVQFEQFDHEFAMGIGDAFAWQELTAFELAHFAHLCGVPLATLQRECVRLAKEIPKHAQDLLASELYLAEELPMLQKIVALACDNSKRLVQMVKEAKVFTAEHF
jgi:serine/threonine-protein kinase HipA